MANASNYPYEVVDIFAISTVFKRDNIVPNPLELPIKTEIKITDTVFPTLQVNVKVSTPADTPVSINFEVVGLFNYTGKGHEFEQVKEFVSVKALSLVWVQAVQMVRLITGQMGMNPIKLNTPNFFEMFQKEEKAL